MNKVFLFLSLFFVSFTNAQLRDSVRVTNRVFDVVYSEKLEQPKWLIYRSTNRITSVNRGSMDFYIEPNIKTSDATDYYANEWDKGHLAPAATFSDSLNLLKQTFSYLNCMLQQQDLNRGEWRILEEHERIWDNDETLTIKIELIFDATSKKLASGATIPSYIYKHIYFEKQKRWRCFKFPNQKPTLRWNQYEIICSSH